MPTTNFSVKKLTSSVAVASSLLLGSIAAQAGVAPTCPGIVQGATQASAVLSDTFQQGAATSYNFTVCNLSDPSVGDGEVGFAGVIRDWELPWDPNAGIDNIRVPFGWDWQIETRGVTNADTGWGGVIEWQDPNDPFYDPRFADHTQVLHFYTSCGRPIANDFTASLTNDSAVGCNQLPQEWIPAGTNNQLSGFGFDSPFSETNSPYQASWLFLPVNTGDPAFPQPGAAFSPSFFAPASTIPEPTSLALMSLALFAAGRKCKKARI